MEGRSGSGDDKGGRRTVPPPPLYELHVRGHLGETIRSAFQGFTAERGEGRTVLRGVLRDQAALHGVLAQIEALGLELLELRRLPPTEEAEVRRP